jgi:proteasome accessory factor C
VLVAPGPVDGVRDVVDEALRRRVAVSFAYSPPDAATTTRTVDPVKVHIANGQWYLQGWCHLRQAMRTFHLERVGDVTLTDIAVTHGGEPVPELFEPGENDATARIRFPVTIEPLLADYLQRAVVTELGDDRIATVRIADQHSLKRLAARRGGQVEVLEPAASRHAAASWAAAGLAQYRRD